MKKALLHTAVFLLVLFGAWSTGYMMGELRASTRTRQAQEHAGRWEGIADGRGEMMRACLSTTEKQR